MHRRIIRSSFSKDNTRLLLVTQDLPEQPGGEGRFTVWWLKASMDEPPRPIISYRVPYGSFSEVNRLRAVASTMARTLANVRELKEFERLITTPMEDWNAKGTPIQTPTV